MDSRYSGVSGFLPGRASLMLDVIVVSMFFVLLALGYSIYSVKYRQQYHRHKLIQISKPDANSLEITERTQAGPSLCVLWPGATSD